MLQREKSATLLQIGIGLFVLGLVAKFALYIAALLNSFSWLFLLAGIVLIVIALATPGRRY